MHHLLEQNAAMHSELPIDNVITLHYVLQAWRIVSTIAIVSGFVTFGVRVHCNPNPRLALERAVNWELLNNVLAF